MAVDWEAVEREYRAGVKTLRQMAEEFSVSNGRIAQVAKKKGWSRDLSAKIKAKAAERVSREAVSKEVSKDRLLRDDEIVNANAKIQSDIILAHRQDIPLKRELVSKLFAEVEALTDNGDLIKEAKKALRAEDMKALADAIGKVTNLPARIKGAADLVNAFKTLVGLERQVFGIEDDNSKLKGTITLSITGDESGL